jgi:protein transport protein SEC24
MFLYIGRNAVPLLISDIFGPSSTSLSDLNPVQSHLPDLSSQLSTQIRNIISYIQESRPSRSLHIQLTRQTIDGAEHEFASLLIEDSNNEAQAYTEFLPYLHRQINSEVES